MLNTKSIREFVCYCTIGVINTAVHYAVFKLTLVVIAWQFIANTFGFSCGLIVSFFLNSKFTFKRQMSLFRFIKLGIANGSIAFLFGAIGDIFCLHPTFTFIIYVIVNPVIGFLLAKFFVFK